MKFHIEKFTHFVLALVIFGSNLLLSYIRSTAPPPSTWCIQE